MWKAFAVPAVWAFAFLASAKRATTEPVFYYALWATFWISIA
jgi:hypothetical protein